MTTIADIRSQYPQYSDMSDEALADAMHSKFYADMPRDEFNAKVGLKSTGNEVFAERMKLAETGIGAVKEVGKQIAGVGEMALSGAKSLIPGTDEYKAEQRHRKGEFTPEEREASDKFAGDVKQAVTHPLDTARGALTDWMEKALPTPTTPQEAQERGGALVRGAEAIPAWAGAIRDVAGLVARPVERALAPAAEKIAAKGEAKVAAENAAAQEKNDLIREVRKLKLRLTSQDVGAPIGKRVEAVASRPQLEREISLSNAARVKEAAAADVGIKEPLSGGAVQKAISETLPAYTAPRSLGRVDLASDKAWQATLKDIRGTTEKEAMDFPEDFNEKLDKEIAKFNKSSADADTLVSKIRKLRERASDNFRAGNAEDVELARAQRKLATAMEEAIERHGEAIGKSGVIADFRAARERLAKLYTIRDSLTTTGELDLGELEKRLDKGEPLTGNLKTLARAKSAFDRSFQNPENIRGHPVGAGDIALGIIAGGGKGAAAGGVAGLGAGAAAAAARPATRMVLGSEPYQSAFIKPQVATPSLLTKAARNVADAGKSKAPTLASAEKKLKVKMKKHTLREDSERESASR